MPPFAAQPNLDVSNEHRSWSVLFWMVTMIIGAAAGLAGGLLMRLLRAIETSVWHYQQGTLLDAISATQPATIVLVLCIAGVLVGCFNGSVARIFGRSVDVDSAIWFRSGQVRALPALANAVGSIIVVGMGTSLGRESAIKQAGGVIASQISRWLRLSRTEQRVLVACGVGAGMAAAYNVPVGGALFAVEVLLGCISLRIVLPALVCSVMATVASWALLPTGPVYDVPEYPLSVSLVVWSLWAGPVLGLATIPLVRAFAWAEAHKPTSGPRRFIQPIITLTLLGMLAIMFPQLLGNGQNAVQVAFRAEFSMYLLFVLAPLKLLATTGCLASGARGGLFTPTMMIGAMLGGLLGQLWEMIFPGASLGCCAVIGASAFLAAASQGPVSALVLVLELTRHVDGTMVPMLLAVSGAMLVARCIESQSIYSARIYSRLGTSSAAGQHTSFDRLISKEFTAIPASTGYAQLLEQFLRPTFVSPAYIIDHEGKLLGAIEASDLQVACLGAMPMEAAKAADLFVPVQSLNSSMTEQDVIDRLNRQSSSQLPVVDAASGRLLGIVIKGQVTS